MLDIYKTKSDKEVEALKAEIIELKKDKARLDWLADKDNPISGVQLPREIVLSNLDGGLRGMIDAAMELNQ